MSEANSPQASAASQTMSQEEVEKLLAMVGSGPGGGEAHAAAGEGAGGHGLVTKFEFPQASSYSSQELRKLRARFESFIVAAGSRLSVHLNMECAMQLTRLDTVRFGQFINTLANPTHLSLFRLEPLRGICLLDLPPRLALTIVDRELGGPASPTDDLRDLSVVECKIVSKVLGVLLTEWCAAWSDIIQLRPVLIRHETSGRHVDVPLGAPAMLALGLETQLSQTVEQIQIAIPLHVLEPMLMKLNSDMRNNDVPASAPMRSSVNWNPVYNEVPIDVKAVWQGMELTARQIRDLKPGDVIPLRPSTTSQVYLNLDETPKFAGQLGAAGKQLAIRVVEPI